MSLFNTFTMIVHRYDNGNYDTPDRSWQPGAEAVGSPFLIEGSWQPASGEDLKPLPEGYRADSIFKVYTSTKLRTVQQKDQFPPDIIESPLDSERYLISQAGNYQNNLISHYKYLAIREKEVDI